jgi:hypothetical protein
MELTDRINQARSQYEVDRYSFNPDQKRDESGKWSKSEDESNSDYHKARDEATEATRVSHVQTKDAVTYAPWRFTTKVLSPSMQEALEKQRSNKPAYEFSSNAIEMAKRGYHGIASEFHQAAAEDHQKAIDEHPWGREKERHHLAKNGHLEASELHLKAHALQKKRAADDRPSE